MKKLYLFLLFILVPLVHAQGVLPPKEFFVKDYEPQSLIVVGDTASADDVISATLLATRIAEMTAPTQIKITETVLSESEHTVLNKTPFVRSNYVLFFDLDEDEFFFDYRLEKLPDTIPGGFIPTFGRTWASRATQINLLGDYYSMLEIRKYNDSSLWYLLYGIPRNYEHQYFKKGESRTYGKYTVTLLEVDLDELEAEILVSGPVNETVFLPVYCKDCKHVVGELFCNATDPLPPLEAADQLQRDYPSFFISLKYFVGGPLSNPDAVARANWYGGLVAGVPDMFMDGDTHIGVSPDYYTDYFTAFYTSVQTEIPLRVYTTGFIREDLGQVNTFLSSDYNLDNLALNVILFEKMVKSGGVLYRNVVRSVSIPVYFSMKAGQTLEYSYTFSIPPSVTNPLENLGVVVFVQDTVTKRIHQADVLDLGEKKLVYEVDTDCDLDKTGEVEFAIECTKIPFLGVQGNAWARFNIYTLMDCGVLSPMCCDTPFFEDGYMKWDLEIFKENDLGYIMVKVCNPFDISCLKPGDLIYGPRHLARIEVLEVTATSVRFLFQFMKVVATEVEGERQVEPSGLVRLASEITERDLKYNIILIGGPDVNPFTEEIVRMGLSKVDWSQSRGEWEFIESPFGKGDALIVAGKDRSGTKFAARKLYYALELYE